MLIECFFPETRRLHPDDRSRIAAQVLRMLGVTGFSGFVLGAVLIIPSVVAALAMDDVLRSTYGVRVSPLLVFAASCIFAQTVWAFAVRRSVRLHVREELNKRGFPVCTACGYDLTGNVTRTCPECGRRVDQAH